jgi:hypothetical protein
MLAILDLFAVVVVVVAAAIVVVTWRDLPMHRYI